MTREDVLRMSREAGLNIGTIQQYERFAALVAKKAVEAEREACAKVCEKKPEMRTTLDGPSIRETVGKRIAAEIRERH